MSEGPEFPIDPEDRRKQAVLNVLTFVFIMLGVWILVTTGK